MEDVDTKLPSSGFYYEGRLVPQYHCMHRYMRRYIHNEGHIYYSQEQLPHTALLSVALWARLVLWGCWR